MSETSGGGVRWAALFGGLGTVLGLVGTAVGIWSQIETNRLQAESTRQKGEIEGLRFKLEEAAAEREDRKLDYEISLKIYDKVITINQKDSDQLRLALALIEVLPNTDFKGRLATSLAALSTAVAGAAGNDSELKASAVKIAESAAFVAQSQVTLNQPSTPPPPAPSRGSAPSATPPRAESPAPVAGGTGWDYDVFWCDGAAAQANQAAAQAVAQKLTGPDAGRIRVRLLPEAINARPGYQLSGNVIRAEVRQAEAAKANEIKHRLDAAERTFRIEPSGQATPWYISVFVCGT